MESTNVAKLQTENLCKSFPSRHHGVNEVLRNITVAVQKGEFVCIVGASGCGKTTFIKMVNGLVPITKGKVLIDGKEVTKPGQDRGFVFQGDSLFPWRTVVDNILFGLEIRGLKRKDSEHTANDLLKMVGLEGFGSHYPHELSGGMRQRVNLARALAIDPDILLMDEPFAALDAQTREIMQQELLRIWEQRQKTVIFITHQIDEAVFLADRVLVFSARPGTIKKEIAIDLPRPRALKVKRTADFLAYVDNIWNLIEEEAIESVKLNL